MIQSNTEKLVQKFQKVSITVPIVFEYDYRFKAEIDLDIDRFEKEFETDIIFLKRISDPKIPYIDVEFTSNMNIGEIRKKMQKMLDYDDCTMIYETLDYTVNYTGKNYFKYHDRKRNCLQCDYCQTLSPATIPNDERLPCCEKCLCVCAEFTHKGENASFDKMKIVEISGVSFRVCEDCVPIFKGV